MRAWGWALQHPFAVLKAEYEAIVASARIRPECERVLDLAAHRLLHDKPVYQRISDATKVPVAVLMALSEREMSGNLHCYLGNGQRLTMRTTIVPIGRGPFPDSIDGFVAGALDALHLDGLDQYDKQFGGWSKPLACYASEAWNGWGYRAQGIPSPYIVGGTTAQRPGKYIRDHVFDRSVMDPQLGTLAIIEKLIEIDPSLDFGDAIPKVVDAPPIVPAPSPVGVGSGDHSLVYRLQDKLNQLKITTVPLAVDGNYGRATRAAVKAYQWQAGLEADGLAGPKTLAALGLTP